MGNRFNLLVAILSLIIIAFVQYNMEALGTEIYFPVLAAMFSFGVFFGDRELSKYLVSIFIGVISFIIQLGIVFFVLDPIVREIYNIKDEFFDWSLWSIIITFFLSVACGIVFFEKYKENLLYEKYFSLLFFSVTLINTLVIIVKRDWISF